MNADFKDEGGHGGRKTDDRGQKVEVFGMKISLIWLFLLVNMVGIPWVAQAGDFTEKDRERLIRMETKVEEGQRALQKQIDALRETTLQQINELRGTSQRQTDGLQLSFQRQIDDLRTFLLWGFGILFGGMGLLIGFVIWDRRTALEPVAKKCRALEEDGDRYSL